jgi:hypothetical protein
MHQTPANRANRGSPALATRHATTTKKGCDQPLAISISLVLVFAVAAWVLYRYGGFSSAASRGGQPRRRSKVRLQGALPATSCPLRGSGRSRQERRSQRPHGQSGRVRRRGHLAIDLKKDMELGPWAPCIDRLAATPDEATKLLADAVKILEARAAYLAERGERV